MRALSQEITGLELPAVEKISNEQAEDPFQILIATALSARTQDATTHAASTRLFKVARTPRTMAALRVKDIEQLIGNLRAHGFSELLEGIRVHQGLRVVGHSG